MAFGFTGFLIQLIVSIIVIAPILWLVGRSMVGKDKAKGTDAVWIVALGVIVGAIIGYFLHGVVGTIVSLIIWLGLIKHFFDCGWLKAIVIAVIAAIVFVIIAFVLAALGVVALIGLGKAMI